MPLLQLSIHNEANDFENDKEYNFNWKPTFHNLDAWVFTFLCEIHHRILPALINDGFVIFLFDCQAAL